MAFLNSPIITYTQILVHRWGTRTRISVLFKRWTKGNVALQGLVPAVDPAPPPPPYFGLQVRPKNFFLNPGPLSVGLDLPMGSKDKLIDFVCHFVTSSLCFVVHCTFTSIHNIFLQLTFNLSINSLVFSLLASSSIVNPPPLYVVILPQWDRPSSSFSVWYVHLLQNSILHINFRTTKRHGWLSALSVGWAVNFSWSHAW